MKVLDNPESEPIKQNVIYYCPTCGYNEGNKIRCPRCGSPMGTTEFKRNLTESLSGFGRREE